MTYARSLILGNAVLTAIFLALGLLAPGRASADGKEPYTLDVHVPAAKVGTQATAKVEIKPAAGYHVNKDYPTSLKLVAVPGVDLPKPTLTKSDGGVKVAEEGASIEVPFTAREKGPKVVSGTVSFALCTATTCDPRKAKLSFTVDAH